MFRENKLKAIIYSFNLLIGIFLIILFILLLVYMPNNLSENKVDDVIINCFLTLNMIDIQSFEYSEPISHLGITGRLIFDCFTGKCTKHEYEYDSDNNF